MTNPIRILFLADSHLGLDLPERPRVERRRRGHDFLANHAAALEAAITGEVDLVVHGGDIFDRPGVSVGIAYQAYRPLLRIAERGVAVVVVPGNHERGRLPHAHLLAHSNVHVFDRPRTYDLERNGVRVALTGFPYERRDVRARFPELLERTNWRATGADVKLLCMHHCVEGATVGPGNYTFTTASDVIRGCDLPAEFVAVLSGHIHRHQVLTRQLCGQALPVPVFYPGSVERTTSAEIGERKGYLLLTVEPGRGKHVGWEFRELPARPMLLRRVPAGERSGSELDRTLRELVASAPADAVLRVTVDGDVCDAHMRVVSASYVRSYAPATMNVEVRIASAMPFARRKERGAQTTAHEKGEANVELAL